MEAFLLKNILWIVTTAFGAGGLAFAFKYQMKRSDRVEELLKTNFKGVHDELAELKKARAGSDVRLAVLETQVEGLSDMKAQLNDIWKHLMRSGFDKEEK